MRRAHRAPRVHGRGAIFAERSPNGAFEYIDHDRPARGGLWARRLRMSEQDTGLRHAVASDVTRDDFDENLTFGEAGSSSAAKRRHSTVRSREGERSSGTSARHALHANLTHAEAAESTWGNNYVTTLPPLRAVGRSEDRRQGHGHDGSGRRQIRLNSQGSEDRRSSASAKCSWLWRSTGGSMHFEHKFQRADHTGLHEAGTGPTTSSERGGCNAVAAGCNTVAGR